MTTNLSAPPDKPRFIPDPHRLPLATANQHITTVVIFSQRRQISDRDPAPRRNPSQVRIYSSPPPKYEEVAIISANSYWSWAWHEQAKMDTATRELREKAAKLGANGVIVKNLGNAAISAGGLGTGAGALAFGAASINNMTTLDGVAIYVPPGQ